MQMYETQNGYSKTIQSNITNNITAFNHLQNLTTVDSPNLHDFQNITFP